VAEAVDAAARAQHLRARRVLCAACASAAVFVALELPLGELLRQRGELARVSRQLALVTGRNTALAGEIASLRRPATIAALAERDYGLVRRGQRSYVVLPSTGAGSALAAASIAPTDVVPTSAAALAGAGPARRTGRSAGLWGRVLDRLAFWRWAF